MNVVPHAPLWAAAHLPRQGGDLSRRCRFLVFEGDVAEQDPISPHAGEMPGRAEGGVSRPTFELVSRSPS